MDAVKSFNAELSSLYDVKPPISKAKMTALTRGAIKAIKFYKHVVQSVEKFILKCKPEYKVPGLYVIDSIVRQSRHQFGSDKDVFAPRFAKNMQQTFVNLFKCPPEDKSKVIRVLNLWQKNQVFAPDVIQPLFDLADPNHPIYKELSAQMQTIGMGQQTTMMKGSPALQKTPTKTPSTSDPGTLAQLGSITNNPSTLDPNTLAQLQQLHRLLMRQTDGSAKPEGQQVHFDRKLLDFDYGSDEEEDPAHPSPKPMNNSAMDNVGSLLSNPEVLRQLQTLQQTMVNNQGLHTEFDLEKLRKLQEMKQQEEEFDKHLAQTVPNLPFASECEFKPSNTNSPAILPPNFFLPSGADLSQPPPGYKPQPYDIHPQDDNAAESEVEFVGANDDIEVIDIDRGESRSPSRDRYRRSRRSRSKDRSRDRNRDRRSRRSRTRSRSRSRSRRYRSRSRDRDRDKGLKDSDREKERERKKRGLPPTKKDNLSVCSTTLWVGHLSKLVHQEDLSDTFGEFGEIVSIDLINPRGCAFIVMHRRQDAARCLAKLKNYKMHSKAITLAWAPGKGVKGKDLKDYWEGDLGVSYIPYIKLKPDMDLEMLEDGGMIDEDTAPQWMKEKLAQMSSAKTDKNDIQNSSSFIQMPEGAPAIDTSQPPPVPNPGLLQPPPMTLPLVAPFQLNNRMLGMPPGMLPNVPMGVPPPNIQGTLMQNPLLGIGSPFAQSLLHNPLTQMPPIGGGDKNQDSVASTMSEQLLQFSMIPPQPPPLSLTQQSEENMDIEMEDADKSDSKTNEHSTSMNDYNGGNDSMSRLHRHMDEDRQRSRNTSRDRDRDRDRNRNSRRDHDRRDRDDRRERNNRWSDRRDNRDERRDREKALNDRLREMAGDNSFREEKDHPPPLLDRPLGGFNSDDKSDRFRRRQDFEGPPLEYESRWNHENSRDYDPPSHDDFDVPPSDYEGRDFDGPPRDYDGPLLDYDGPPRPLLHPRDRFDDRRRGGPPDLFQQRDNFGPRWRFKGPPHGPESFGRGPRGPPTPPWWFYRGPPQPPHMRGPPQPPHMRGPKPPVMYGIRPNFLYDVPSDFFRGPPSPGPGSGNGYDDMPPRFWHERRSGGGRFKNEHDSKPPSDEPYEKPPRQSRWTNSPDQNDDNQMNNQSGSQDSLQLPPNGDDSFGDADTSKVELPLEGGDDSTVEQFQGNTTPLHDEPQDLEQSVKTEIKNELNVKSEPIDEHS